ncbi:MAG TPA: hypothetical protein PKL59_21400, partial [Nitrospira sp.]|nr:hypothetical protein [Nitrospira sp.]
NLSWNCGVEGPTDDPSIERLRNRQVKNFLALTLLSVGAPILLMGDEVRHTQRGNNNAYCQDNDISWFDWTRLGKHADIHRFVRFLLLLRLRSPLARGESSLTLNEILCRARIDWHGIVLNRPDWNDESHSLALTAGTLDGRFLVHVIVNAYWEPLAFELPGAAKSEQGWRRLIDTCLDSPDDICDGPDAPFVPGDSYLTQPRSVVVLFALRASDAK